MSPEPPAAPFELRFNDRGDYLYACVQGPQDSPEITLAYWREIVAECARRDLRRLLVCDDLHGEPATPQDFSKLAEALRGSGLEHLRVAFHEPVSANLRVVEHGELAFREAGFTLRVFGSEREAELWLRYGV
ncbi:MAG TPA: hypothetical protein VN725_05325 [Rhodanobacteraceae bacterium]|nr:hypothetical protein [Rhodanobacteraceae bacterium]